MLCYKNTYRVNNPLTEKSNLLYDGFSFFKKHMRHRKFKMKEISLRLCILRRSEAWKPLTRILRSESFVFQGPCPYLQELQGFSLFLAFLQMKTYCAWYALIVLG